MKLISILVQPSEAFDRDSILRIKLSKIEDLAIKENLTKQIRELEEQINLSIGYMLAQKIYGSLAYEELAHTNLELFDMINLLKKEDISPLLIDKKNYERHLAKKQLQKEFFGNQLEEVKLGYKP